MSCLLPQFKCQPDTLAIHFRTHLHHSTAHTQLAKHREQNYFRAQCSISTVPPSTSTAVLDLEKLRLPSLEADSDSVAGSRPWTFTAVIGPPSEASFGSTLPTETLTTSDEAVIAAAAAEAVTLARAAVKFARDAAVMVNSFRSEKTEIKLPISSATDTFSSMWSQLTERERADVLGDSVAAETRLTEEYSTPDQSNDSDYLEQSEPTNEELELLEKQLSDSIAVKSWRQTERKARRARAAEKVTANIVSVKAGLNRKKRASSQEVDYTDPLRYLRGTTSSSKLLSSNEEMELSAGIQDLLKLERLHEELAERCGAQPTFSQWAAAAGIDRKTLRERLDYGVLCKEKMVKCNIRLVISIAKKYQGAGMSLQDLVQEGCRGLVRGAEKFDASKGFKFSTYAHWWIKQAVRRSLSDQSRIIRLPFHMVEAIYKVKEARKQLYNKHGRDPEDEELAEAAGLSMKRLSAVLLTPKITISLDQKMGPNMDLKPSEILADPDAETSEDILMKQFMKQDLEKVLDSLSEKESLVVRCRFGLDDGRMKTLQEIGEFMGVSRERIRQIESSAFRKLKSKKRMKQLKQYVIP